MPRSCPGPARCSAATARSSTCFLFAPILVVVVYAFNSGSNVAEFAGFSTKWFGARARRRHDHLVDRRARCRSRVASAIVSTVFGTAAALALSQREPAVRTPFDVLVFLTLVVPELVIARLDADLLRQHRLLARAADDVPRPHRVQHVARAAHRARALRVDGAIARGGEPGPRRVRAGDVPAGHAAAPRARDRRRRDAVVHVLVRRRRDLELHVGRRATRRGRCASSSACASACARTSTPRRR